MPRHPSRPRTTEACLLDDLEGLRTVILGQLADDAEDRGKVWLAAGWRWLVRYRSRPKEIRFGTETEWRWCCNSYFEPPSDPDDLPREVADTIDGRHDGSNLFRYHESESAAYKAAAYALARAMKAGKVPVPVPPQQPPP